VSDGKTEVNGVRYHYLLVRGGGDPVVLLHGWGSTSFMWRFALRALAEKGYTVIAPDLRGFGDTDKPVSGYTKAQVADDVATLVTKLGLGPKLHIVGHDVGGMVAYAFAAQHRDSVRSLTIVDVPLPGIPPWENVLADSAVWHIRFFQVRDVPEMLVSGHERPFLSWFYNNQAVNAGAFTDDVLDTYSRAYSAPGALRASFEYFRAFQQDALDNTAFAKTKLAVPVLGIGGAGSFGPIIGSHLRQVADDVRAVSIDGSGHWVAEEQPVAFARALIAFLESH